MASPTCRRIENCTANDNAQSGIYCHIIGQTPGIKADGANNLIVGNIFRSCTNAMLIPAGNRVGTLLTGTFSAAIDGNTGGSLGTTDPNANLLY